MVARPTQPGSGVRVCGVRTQGGLGRVYLDDITASVEVPLASVPRTSVLRLTLQQQSSCS